MEPLEKPRGSPFDINGPDFNPDLYLQKLFKECSLKHIMDCESEVVKDCQLLNSDMQTLVYENYNKFILATDTIKKMKTDFKKMEDEMEMLIQNMNSITSFSEMITSTLQGTHGQISKLSGVHALLKKLQFLFKLPGKLKLLLQEEDYEQAVQEFVKTQPILDYYGDLDSFQGIQKDCNDILQKLKTKLRDQLKNKDTSAKKLIKCIDLLLQLQEPSDQLCSEYLTFVDSRLAEQLSSMQITHSGQDAAEFMDSGANVFLTDLCLIVTSYTDMFLNRTNSLEDSEAVGKLNSFVIRNMNSYLEIVQLKLEGTSEEDTAVLVSALDRLYCRLQAFNSLFTHVDFTVKGMELIISAAHRQCRNHLVSLKSHFADSLARVKQSLAAPKYTSSHTEALRKQELDAFLVTAIDPKLTNVEYTQNLQINPVTSRGIQLAALLMQGIETALLVNDACGAPVPWLMSCPWLYFDGKLFQYQLARANVAKNLLELCDHKTHTLMLVERMKHAILDGLNVQFARPMPMVPTDPRAFLAPAGFMPSGMPVAPPIGGRSGYGGGRFNNRGMGRRAVAGPGAKLEIAGVVVGSWSGNYGYGMSRGVVVRPQVSSVGGNSSYGPNGYMRGRPSYSIRGNKSIGKGRGSRGYQANFNKRKVVVKKEKKSPKGRGMTVTLDSGDPCLASDFLNKTKNLSLDDDNSKESSGLHNVLGDEANVSLSEMMNGGGDSNPKIGQFEDLKRDIFGDGQGLKIVLSPSHAAALAQDL